MSAIEKKSNVIGTVREPDGDINGKIFGLVIDQFSLKGLPYYLEEKEAVRWASKGLLWTHTPGDGNPVQVIAIANRYVRTASDSTTSNNLLKLKVFTRDS